MSQDALSQMREFFSRDACRRATAPLSEGIELAVQVEGEGTFTLVKRGGVLDAVAGEPRRPDMTFHVGQKAVSELVAVRTDDIGEIGVAILKLMANSDPTAQIRPKVHIGVFDMLRHGYFSVLPLGGATVMKFLATKGFTGLGKIKEGISKLRQ